MVRMAQGLLAISFALIGFALATGCLGCAPDANVVELPTTDNNIDPGKIAGGNVDDQIVPVPGDNTPIDNPDPNSNEPFESMVVNGQLCEPPYVVLYDADGEPVECAPNALYTCKGDMALFIRIEGYEEPQQVCDEVEQPPVYDEAICEKLSPADGKWQALWNGGPKGMTPINEFMEVHCTPTEDACSITTIGEGSMIPEMVAFFSTEFPLSAEFDNQVYEMTMAADGKLVQRRYFNGELMAEKFFRR